MPGAKDKSITTHIDEIQDLQEEISKWNTKLNGIHVGSAWEEMLMHLTGLGHLEIFKIGELAKYDATSSKVQFERAVHALNSSLVSLHSSWSHTILMKETLPDQQDNVKKYALAAEKAVDEFDKKWNVHHLPHEVQVKYDRVKVLTTHT